MKQRDAVRKEISGFCKHLSFSQTCVALCETEATMTQEAFLHHAFKSEIRNREDSRKARFLKEAAFPVYKTFDNYDFKSLKMPTALTQQHLKTASFIHEKKNIVMFGQVGTGKSHLAVACGVNACQQDIPVRFFTVAELVVRLSTAMQNGTLEKVLKSILRAELIILDEWGYVPLDRQGAQLLFRIISDSYERRSIIITTNLEFSKWGSVFTDDQLAAAMIDRLAHHGHLIIFEGESYRMKNALMKEK